MKLTLKKHDSMIDWYTIERAEHENEQWDEPTEYGSRLMCSSRICDADVEGTGKEMLAVAKAIEDRSHVSFRRVSVDVLPYRGKVEFWSPRNSRESGFCTIEEADELVKIIRETVNKKPA